MAEFLQQFSSGAVLARCNKFSHDLLGWEVPAYFSMYNGFPHLPVLAVTIPAYLLGVYWLQRYLRVNNISMRNNAIINRYAFWHDVFMTVFSMYMLVDCLAKMYAHGAFNSFQAHLAFDGPTEVFAPSYDLFFWSKYLELIDTFILVFKGKQLGFLHLFHHSTTASVGYVGRYQCIWLGEWTNCLVHVGMYIHFARPINFLRKYLTSLQIVQFLWVLFAYNYWFQHSSLSWTDVAYQMACYGIYLVFFVHFFYTNYFVRAPSKHGKAHNTGDLLKKEQ